MEVEKNQHAGKKLKEEFALLGAYQDTVKGQARRLVYRWEKDLIILFSFGPERAYTSSLARNNGE